MEQSPLFMEPEGSLPSSQESVTCPCKPDAWSPHLLTLFS